jgi:hypothetical protein
MTDWNNIDEVIILALEEAFCRNDEGKLFKSTEIDPNNTDFGCDGEETVYSLISMYADSEHNDGTWEDKLETALRTEFEDYF